jgi:hypothetical protein
MSKKPSNYKPLFKIWDGTTVHASMDTLIGQDLSLRLREMGFKAEHKGFWSFEDLHNGKIAYVTHTRRLGSVNPFSVTQSESKQFKCNIQDGKLPENLSMRVGAHGHSCEGTIDDNSFKILNLPCWTSFIEYAKADANFAGYQPDIGAYFIIVTKEGRVKLQPWIYKSFNYEINAGKIYFGKASDKHFVDADVELVIEPYLRELCKGAKFIIACVADFHVGELAAIAPNKYTYNGIEYNINQSPANKQILGYWKNFVKACKIIKPNEVWIVGDMLAGTQVFEKTRRTLTVNLEEQKSMWSELFKEFL